MSATRPDPQEAVSHCSLPLPHLHGEDGLRKVPGPQVQLPDPLLHGERPEDQPRSHSARPGRVGCLLQSALFGGGGALLAAFL